MDILLNTVDSVLSRYITETNGFDDFCSILNDMEMLSEAVANADAGRHQIDKIIANTSKTSRDIAKIYGISTDAGGAAIKSVWDLGMKLLTLATSAIAFIVKNIVKIPEAINKLIDKLVSIPSNVKARIRGDIQLYVTIEDLQTLNNQYVLNHMTNLLVLAKEFSAGEVWTSFWGKKERRDSGLNTNDARTLKEMKAEFAYFSKINMTKTVVNMSDANVVEGYFGNGKIEYKDIHGKMHSSTYYESLKALISEISSKKNVLDGLYTAIGDKLKTTQDNGSFSELNKVRKDAIINGMSMMTTTINLIGNLVKNMMTDVATIQKTTDQIMSRKGKIAKGSTKKTNIVGRDDNAIKNLDVNDDPGNDYEYEKNWLSNGYVKIPKYSKDKTGRVVTAHTGKPHKFNSDIVWVKKGNIPKGVKPLK